MRLDLYVIGDSTTARMHHLFKEEFGDRYDRYRGTAYNDTHDGTWNCKNVDFILAYALPEALKHITEDTTVLINSGLWDIGVHIDKPMINPYIYKYGLYFIFDLLLNKTDKVHCFETIRTTLEVKNVLIDDYNDILRTTAYDTGVNFIETQKPMGFSLDMYEPEGYHYKPAANKKLYDIIVPPPLRENK